LPASRMRARRAAPTRARRPPQVCLAAETCGHVSFNTRGDVWYSSEPFHCGDTPPGHVTYWQIFRKVRGVCLAARGALVLCLGPCLLTPLWLFVTAIGSCLCPQQYNCTRARLCCFTCHVHVLSPGGADGHAVGLRHGRGRGAPLPAQLQGSGSGAAQRAVPAAAGGAAAHGHHRWGRVLGGRALGWCTLA
jgi:hypothetical protein